MKNFNGNELLSLKYNQINIVRDDNKEVYLGERKEDNKKVVIKQINLLDGFRTSKYNKILRLYF